MFFKYEINATKSSVLTVIISAIFRMKLVNFVHVCIPRTGMSHACGLVFGAGFGFQRQYIDLTNEQNDK